MLRLVWHLTLAIIIIIGSLSIGVLGHHFTENFTWIDALLNASMILGGKTVLTIGDALFAAKVFNDTPKTWTTSGSQLPNSIFLSIGPVAIDCVMHDHIVAELGSKVTSGSNNYLKLAANAGLGRFESRNPWIQNYFHINYQKFVI